MYFTRAFPSTWKRQVALVHTNGVYFFVRHSHHFNFIFLCLIDYVIPNTTLVFTSHCKRDCGSIQSYQGLASNIGIT